MKNLSIDELAGIVIVLGFVGTTVYWILFYKLRVDFPTLEHLRDNYLSQNSAEDKYVSQKQVDIHIQSMKESLERLEKSVTSIQNLMMGKSHN